MTNSSALFQDQYALKAGSVFWRDVPVSGVDATTFLSLGGTWGQDAMHIYCQGSIKRGIDIATFRFLNPVYVKDAYGVYDWEGKIKGADAETFDVLDAGIVIDDEVWCASWARGYASDRDKVYYHDQMIGRATALRGADPLTFVSLRNDYGLDGNSVWHQKERLSGADPKSWLPLGRLWSIDSEHLYYAERIVTGINPKTFKVVNAPTIGTLATDGNVHLDADIPIPEAEFWGRLEKDFGSFIERLRTDLLRTDLKSSPY